MKRTLTWMWSLALALVLVACGDDSDSTADAMTDTGGGGATGGATTGGTTTGGAVTGGAATGGMATGGAATGGATGGGTTEPTPTGIDVASLPMPPTTPGEWVAIEPGGNTICSKGSPFRFFVRAGDPNKVVIDFRGGGACWDLLTCGFNEQNPTFSEEAGTLDQLMAFGERGIYDTDNMENPLRDYTLIHIPYCTGDIHWGDNVQMYLPGVTLNHRGGVNARAVLEWVNTHYTTPNDIFVNGCSAGAYGAVFHSAQIADTYPDAQIAVFSDSGAGIITDDFFEVSLPNWGALDQLPANVERLQKAMLTSADLYAGIANTYPNVRFSQYTTTFDRDQTFFFTAMGGDAADWPGLARARMQEFATDASDNFRVFSPAGPVHCISIYDGFYTQEVNGVRLVDWVTQFIEGDTLPDNQYCEGQDCFNDVLCDACANDSSLDYCRWCSSPTWPDDYMDRWPPMMSTP